MKIKLPWHAKSLPLALVYPVFGVSAQVYDSTFASISAAIPDNNSSGYVSSETVSGPNVTIQSLTVSLSLSGVGAGGGFNGDMYVLLRHDNKSTILLNRVGKDASNPFGYGDNGMNVTFADNASNGDIHIYQQTVNPGGGTLTGTWAPDGRRTDPSQVTTASARNSSLANFAGLPMDGSWTLYLVDLSSGGQLRLDSWALHFTTVPEPVSTSFLAGISLFAFAGWRWIRFRKTDSSCD